MCSGRGLGVSKTVSQYVGECAEGLWGKLFFHRNCSFETMILWAISFSLREKWEFSIFDKFGTLKQAFGQCQSIIPNVAKNLSQKMRHDGSGWTGMERFFWICLTKNGSREAATVERNSHSLRLLSRGLKIHLANQGIESNFRRKIRKKSFAFSSHGTVTWQKQKMDAQYFLGRLLTSWVFRSQNVSTWRLMINLTKKRYLVRQTSHCSP